METVKNVETKRKTFFSQALTMPMPFQNLSKESRGIIGQNRKI